jgi:hypothetical protein
MELLKTFEPRMSRWSSSRASLAIKKGRDWGMLGTKRYFTMEQEILFLNFILHHQSHGIAYTYRQIEDLVFFSSPFL